MSEAKNERMRAVVQDRYGSYEVLEVRETPRPQVLEDDQLLLEVVAAAVNPADWHIMSGRPVLVKIAQGRKAPKPAVRGLEVAGRVVEVGSAVARFKVGDEVWGAASSGGFAEYAVTREKYLVKKTEAMSFEEAAAVPTAALTALQALRDKGAVSEGQKVLVIGAGGGVGSFTVQLAKHFGAHVTGVCSGAKVEAVKGLGADEVIDYEKAGIEGVFDLIVDMAGNRPLRQLRRNLTKEGTLVIVGAEVEGKWFAGLGRAMRSLVLKPFIKQKLLAFFASVNREDLEYLGGLLEEGTIKPLISKTYSLEEVPQAIQDQHEAHVLGKLVVVIGK